MSTITVYESKQVTVWCYPEKGIIHHQMHEYTHGEDFRKALMAGVGAMKKYHAKKWLSDDRNNPLLRPDDQEWGTTVWQPAVFEAGWKYWAIVPPEYELAKARMAKLSDQFLSRGIKVEFFSDPDAAMAWLENQ